MNEDGNWDAVDLSWVEIVSWMSGVLIAYVTWSRECQVWSGCQTGDRRLKPQPNLSELKYITSAVVVSLNCRSFSLSYPNLTVLPNPQPKGHYYTSSGHCTIALKEPRLTSPIKTNSCTNSSQFFSLNYFTSIYFRTWTPIFEVKWTPVVQY